MTEREFLNAVSNGKEDILQVFLQTLVDAQVDYCVIGGLAVNAYAEPVVSLDLDVAVAPDDVDKVCNALPPHYQAERFPHSVNLSTETSDLRIQLQTDPRYREFIPRAATHRVLGYEMRVARVEDVLQGKIWAALDQDRRASKRQKDLADIARLIEARPALAELVPQEISSRIS